MLYQLSYTPTLPCPSGPDFWKWTERHRINDPHGAFVSLPEPGRLAVASVGGKATAVAMFLNRLAIVATAWTIGTRRDRGP